MNPENKKRPLDDTADHWDNNPIQEESDLLFNRPIHAHKEDAEQFEKDYPDESDRQMRQNIEAGRENQREAERKEWEAAENRFGYRKPGDQQPTTPRRRFARLANRKNAIRGGIAGGSIGIFLALFSFLTPFKIPAIMQVITDEAGQRVEQITIHRAKVIMARAILSNFGYKGGVVITGTGPVSSLIATMRTNGFEKKLKASFAEKGISYVTDGDGIRLSRNGQNLGTFKGKGAEERLLKAIAEDKITSKVIDDIVRQEIPTWRFMKRAKFASWLRIKYGIARFGVAKSTETDKEKKLQAMQEERVKTGAQRSTGNALQAMDCLSEGPNCPIKDGKNGQNSALSSSDQSKNAVQTSLTEAGEEVAEEAGKLAAKGAVGTGAKLSTKIAVKAIPIIGWIDLAATINHAVIVIGKAADDDVITKIPAYFRAQSYAQIYGDWAGYGDQIKAGEMDRDFMGVLATQMDGIETSQAYACMSRTSGTGSIVAQLTSSSTAYAAEQPCSAEGVPVKVRIDENNPSLLKQKMNELNDTLGFDAYGLGSALHQATPSYWVLEAWYYLSNKITDAAVDVIMNQFQIQLSILDTIASAITGVDVASERQKWMSEVINKFMGGMLSFLGLVIDPMDSGADLGNNLVGGGVVSFNTYCEELGCRKLDTKQAREQTQAIAYERAEQKSNGDWLYNSFSPDANGSLTNQLAIALPSALTPQKFNLIQGGSQLANMIASVPGKLVSSLLGSPTQAATPLLVEDLYGKNIFGATAADLSQPLAEESVTGATCPEVAKGEYNNCNIDKTVAEAMYCNFDAGNSKCSFVTGVGATGGINVMSYNILGSTHNNDGGVNWEKRLVNTVATVNERRPSVIGFQEVDTNQYPKLTAMLSDNYDFYPKKVGSSSSRVIAWDKSVFKDNPNDSKGQGLFNFPRYDNPSADSPWVKLTHIASNNPLYVFNSHLSAGDHNSNQYDSPDGSSPPIARRDQAKKMVAAIKDITGSSSAPVIATGDYNSTCAVSGNDSPMGIDDLPCTIFNKAGYDNAGILAKNSGVSMINADYSTSHGAAGERKQGGRHIDHVYIRRTAGITVNQWENIIDDDTTRASDHSPVIVSLTIAGMTNSPSAAGGSGEVTASGFAWPLGEKLWKENKANFLGRHYGSGGFLGDGGESVDISFGGALGKPVYAVLGGEVVTKPLGRGTYGPICNGSTPNPGQKDNGGLTIKSSLNGHSVLIAYAHGTDVKFSKGSSVETGKQIMLLGNRGNSCGPHLHMNITVDGKNICPQDLFLAMDKGGSIDLAALTKKATRECEGRS